MKQVSYEAERLMWGITEFQRAQIIEAEMGQHYSNHFNGSSISVHYVS